MVTKDERAKLRAAVNMARVKRDLSILLDPETLTALLDALDEAEKALAWYGDAWNWQPEKVLTISWEGDERYRPGPSAAQREAGKRAREALARLRGEKSGAE